MKYKLLIICGPTATGKTSLAITLANKFNGELISADSRQLYRKMDIGTGKEWGDAVIHGYDLAEPAESYSVSQYVKFANKTIEDIVHRGKLPILIGGTGLYIKGVVDGIGTVEIPKNEDLRATLENKSVHELYEQLATLDSTKAASMNASDKSNPRRLVRAIEIAIWKMDNSGGPSEVKKEDGRYKPLFVGLYADEKYLLEKITKRVESRMDNGFVYEVEDLLKDGISWKNQSMQSIGYKELEDFLKKGLSYEEFIKNWINSEKRYVKRQMTWFKKDKRINWFDVKSNDYSEKVAKLVKRWLNTS